MGIMDFFRGKRIEETQADINNVEAKSEDKFVSDISMFELDNVDWSEFGALLKQNKILPNSYVKKPTKVEIMLDKKNRPKVMIEFKSATSNSIREYMLLQDGVFQYVNGAIDDGKNQDLIGLWKRFQEEIRYRNEIYTNRQGYSHKRRGERLMKDAEKMMNMDNIYELEQAFLEKHKDAKFDEFCYSAIFERDRNGFINYVGELPRFVPLEETKDGYLVAGEPVIPFSPRTLEHCILHMTNGQKIENGEYLEDFEQMCRKLQKYSCFESENWDKVIEFGKDVVRTQYQVHCLENGFEME